jgi:hypothetical protein
MKNENTSRAWGRAYRMEFSSVPFERYADDALAHCKTQKQAEYVKLDFGRTNAIKTVKQAKLARMERIRRCG